MKYIKQTIINYIPLNEDVKRAIREDIKDGWNIKDEITDRDVEIDIQQRLAESESVFQFCEDLFIDHGLIEIHEDFEIIEREK